MFFRSICKNVSYQTDGWLVNILQCLLKMRVAVHLRYRNVRILYQSSDLPQLPDRKKHTVMYRNGQIVSLTVFVT